MQDPIINLGSVKLQPHGHGQRFEARLAQIGPLIGARKLGARLVELPPGKCAWPFHSHHVNEEMFIILEGAGELRLGESLHLIRAGDIISCPPGGAESAHQIVASEEGPIRYLALSTMEPTDVMEYPDSGKVGVFAGAAPGGDSASRQVAMFLPAAAAVDYWQDEDAD